MTKEEVSGFYGLLTVIMDNHQVVYLLEQMSNTALFSWLHSNISPFGDGESFMQQCRFEEMKEGRKMLVLKKVI